MGIDILSTTMRERRSVRDRRVFTRSRLCVGALCAAALLSSGSAYAADLILHNARIFTAARNGPRWAEAIAITNGKIDAVGSEAGVGRLKTKHTRVIDLHGRMVIPGIVDSHAHLWYGSQVRDGFNLLSPDGTITPKDGELFVNAIRTFATGHPEKPVILGRSDYSMARTVPGAVPIRQLLDQAVPDRPVAIHHVTEHAYIVNSKALELAGITKAPLPDPLEEKYIDRDSDGNPTGLILEGAMQAIERTLPRPSLAEQARIMGNGLRYLNSFGVTSALATTGGSADLKVFDELRRQGQLTMRVRQAYASLAVNHHLDRGFLAELENARRTYNDAWISANAVKFFMDGIRTPNFYSEDDFTTVVKELDKRGFQIITHAFSPEAIETVLNGYERVDQANGPRVQPFRIEHVIQISDATINRFKQLHVIASMQPAFCCFPPGSSRWNSLLKAGVTVSFSSDFPCTWPPSPMLGIEEAATRYLKRPLTPAGPVGPIVSDDHPEERISAEQALLAYTRDGAVSGGWEKDRGTLEVGKLADLVVLSQNILDIPPEKIGETAIVATVVDGKAVFGKLD